MLKIYNNKTKKKENFIPINENEISMYVCGPTLYGDIHIGNARPIVFFDVVYRFFKKQNINIKYVSNITDIDDKIINKAIIENLSEKELVDKNLVKFKEDLKFLNIKDIDIRPLVTDYIENIIDFIDELIKKDYAYVTENKDVYFKIEKINDYGKIANRNIDDLIAGSRVDVDHYKKNALDFVLWKNTNVGITWNAPFGKGRPGWHTECVVLIKELLGNKIDIHGGGVDLKFPHHENENAQCCALNNDDLANYWVHNGFVNINNEKMSKSLNNFISINEMKKYDTNIIRLILLQTNYRQPINLSNTFIEQTIKLNNKLINYTNDITKEQYEKFLNDDLNEEIIEVLNDDFNTPNLISLLLNKMKENDHKCFVLICDLLGLKFNYPIKKDKLPSEVLDLITLIEIAKDEKNFNELDKLKKKLVDMSYEFVQTRSGYVIKEI